jgi:hypothetical protein
MIEGSTAKLAAPVTSVAKTTPASATPVAKVEKASFKQVLESLGKEAKRGEALVERASHAHGDISNGDMIALQAGVYRYVEVVDLASKLVDRATQAAKTVTQGNGG